jgi:hypothetical protein
VELAGKRNAEEEGISGQGATLRKKWNYRPRGNAEGVR